MNTILSKDNDTILEGQCRIIANKVIKPTCMNCRNFIRLEFPNYNSNIIEIHEYCSIPKYRIQCSKNDSLINWRVVTLTDGSILWKKTKQE